MQERSELALLVETEHRLDQEIAAAKQAAAAARDAAELRAKTSLADLEANLDREHAKIATEIAAATTARRRAIEDGAAAKVARYEAMRGAALAELARRLARRLVELDEEDAP